MTNKCYVIPTQKVCNADCTFCISKVRNYNKACEFLHVDDTFTDTIQMLARRGVNRFEITGGGEPFLNSELDSIVQTIKRLVPNSYIKLYTNGRILKAIPGIDELNISVATLDKDTNDQIMGGVDKTSLIEKIEFFRNSNPGMKIRLSIPLLKGGIDTPRKLDEIINATKKYGITYVVRTLYPHSINRDESFVDFPYENELVTMERDNGVDDFDGLILWSDGKIYSNWKLDEERKLLSYMVLKPDSKQHLSEIIETVKAHGFLIPHILFTDDFNNFASCLYTDKDEEYFKNVKRHLDLTSFLFGNDALVLILDKDLPYEDLIAETYELKKTLRKLYSFTGLKNGFLLVGDNISHLNIAHAPDPTRENYERDLRYIDSLGLERVSESRLSLMKKYRSYHL